MLNGAALNSFAINGSAKSVTNAYAEIQLSFDCEASPVRVKVANSDIGIEFIVYALGDKIELAFSIIGIEFALDNIPTGEFYDSANVDIEVFISPSSEFEVFAHAFIEFHTEAIANDILGYAESVIYVDIVGKATKITFANAVIDTEFTIDKSDTVRVLGAEAEVDIEFQGFFAPDLNMVRDTGANIGIQFVVDSATSTSPRLSVLEIEFDCEGDTEIYRATFATINTFIFALANATRVRLAESSSSIEFSVDATSTLITTETAIIDTEFSFEAEAFHDAFAITDCIIDFDFYSFAFYKLPSVAICETSFEISSETSIYVSASSEIGFSFAIEQDDEHIKLAEQIYATILTEFVVSAISVYLYKAEADIVCEFTTSPISSFIYGALSEIYIEILISEANGLIGAYEPADECRTIFVEPDFNIIFVPYEERELRIAC